jgi:hypothetical protein
MNALHASRYFDAFGELDGYLEDDVAEQHMHSNKQLAEYLTQLLSKAILDSVKGLKPRTTRSRPTTLAQWKVNRSSPASTKFSGAK